MKKIVLASALALAFTAPAFAGDKMSDSEVKEKFNMHDTNKDGYLSKSEWDAAGVEMWKKADTNNDGKISLEEKKALAEKEHNS